MTANPLVQPSNGQLDSAEIETFRVYYSLQYQRIAQHEHGRLQVSNYVVAASVVALGILALPTEKVTLAAIGVPLAVAVVNILAVVYASRSRRWVKLHQARAAATLIKLSPTLADLQTKVDAQKERIDSNKSPIRSQLLQAYIHWVIVVMGVLVSLQWML